MTFFDENFSSDSSSTCAGLQSTNVVAFAPNPKHQPHLKCLKRVGTGGFAEVHQGLYKQGGYQGLVAVKAPKLETKNCPREMQCFIREIQMVQRFQHEHIVKFVACHWDNLHTPPSLLLEFMDGGMLKSLVTKQMLTTKRLYSDGTALRWLLQAGRAVRYLHSLSPMVIHRDVSLANILLKGTETEMMHAKICDFGLSVEVQLDSACPGCPDLRYSLTAETGNLLYMAPESFKGEPYNEKVDVFSFGTVMYELFLRTVLLFKVAPRGMRSEITQFATDVANGYRLPLNAIPDPLAALITACWCQDPAERPSMEKVVAILENVQDVLGSMDEAHPEGCHCVVC